MKFIMAYLKYFWGCIITKGYKYPSCCKKAKLEIASGVVVSGSGKFRFAHGDVINYCRWCGKRVKHPVEY